MISAYIDGYGKNQKLKIGDRPKPITGPTDILVKIHAASVNPIDFKIRDGMLKFLRSYPFPLTLGHDCAGEVIEVGPLVKKFKVGDKIFSRPRNERIGTFAEYISIDENEAALMPANISFQEAASIPLVGLTTWQALIGVAKLKPKQKILIHAGSGGVGTFAVQLAKHLGAEVWATTSGKNVDFVKSLGADHIINYKEQNFENAVSEMDVVFDTLGGDTLNKSFSVVKAGGWVVSISGSPDHRTGLDMNLGFLKTQILRLVGLAVNLRAKKFKVNYNFVFMKPSGEELKQIAELMTKGVIKPVVDKVFPLVESQAALDYSESGRARGKIVIKV